ncbi:glycoside hydrolase family 127 protein [Sphingomonas sp. S1-29]|uniref:glycoside hydrolase family 127 protein n=1 Tax=Sphingomonas sp. S1-29 TaxID=2991074 RepID=UPI0022401FF1|nr:glycoside hydrolase family 127 protein [Sphingomonas sp. S1-29]UZK68965.1 glycoside hydrolase family 127 protein [Sphingomonas sp. S1-29]
MITRRTLLGSASALVFARPLAALGADRAAAARRSVPLSAVRLLPSAFATAQETNRKTLLALSPERLLHNFHLSAGLPPQGEIYGGWEARGIAGHTLGHWLSAASLMVASTGDAELRRRLAKTVGELATIQAAHGDGYIGGTTVERDGKEVDGKIVFEEIRRGEVRTSGFDVNGGWVPLYTWHKVHAGLIDAERHAGIAAARPVMLGMAGYLADILDTLDDATLQRLLAAEYGGLNDSYAETHALTGNPRWLALAIRIRDTKVLDPLAAGRNNLAGLHANTQIPKVIGLARIHELNGDPKAAATARFFHQTVTRDHSYVIGGNSDREHFGLPRQLSSAITERTCEACNSYNMLKLTRHLYSWSGDPALFDYYERTHLNHILAHQHPDHGRFVYFMPLSSGARRTYSTPEDSFWCCVGSGLESHAKHGDSIWWDDGKALVANLFIPSKVDWRGWRVTMDTAFPFSQRVTCTIEAAPRGAATLALRLPGWCDAPALAVNGKAEPVSGGEARIARRWREGDVVTLDLPMRLAAEPMPDNADMVAFTHGPLVLAADLGPADAPFDGLPPAIVGAGALEGVVPADPAQHRFTLASAQPSKLALVPFFAQYDRRTAVYFPRFTPERWATEEAAWRKARAAEAALAARTIDQMFFGEMQPERDHAFTANHSDLFSFAGKSARQLPWGAGNWMEFTMAVRPGPVTLQLLYWGEEVDKHFAVSVNGRQIAVERRPGPAQKRFVTADYALPAELVGDAAQIRVRVETIGTDAMVYEARTLGPGGAAVTS